ncbi:hypothetical protein [Streptomyces sp. NPDC005209]|uniref:hypothetical protein n=1 Tax=Streptomyces sp. NPDC005209 TaxID=3156715 RepID=UPI00339F7572
MSSPTSRRRRDRAPGPSAGRQGLPQPRRTPQPPPAPPSTRQVTGWLTRRPASLTEDEHQQLKAVLGGCPELATAHQLVRDIGDMLTQRTGALLPAWIDDAVAADLPGLTGAALDEATFPVDTRNS